MPVCSDVLGHLRMCCEGMGMSLCVRLFVFVSWHLYVCALKDCVSGVFSCFVVFFFRNVRCLTASVFSFFISMLHRRSAVPVAQRGCAHLLHTARVVGSQRWTPLAGPVDEAPRLLRKWTGNAALIRYVERTIVCCSSLLLFFDIHTSACTSHSFMFLSVCFLLFVIVAVPTGPSAPV